MSKFVWRPVARRDVCRAGLLALAGTLPGCGLLPEVSVPVQLYTVTPKTSYPETLESVDWQLVVEMPNAATSLDTPRIALQRTPFTLEYYAGSAWTDNAPLMVQTLLIESFESTRSITAVGREGVGLRPDYVLKTDLREFEAIYEEGSPNPVIWVRINAKVVKMPERRIVSSATFERREASAGTKLPDIVAAFDEALGHTLKRIVLFVLEEPNV
ncbi:MAG TPA: ABC-type transport auxiliary lipoprotein family protein [Verrucomicrobiae bacterium]|nr:ABC-type transport auxiliary lipoprotein family protein [Verrucomicrobiae bacterium]